MNLIIIYRLFIDKNLKPFLYKNYRHVKLLNYSKINYKSEMKGLLVTIATLSCRPTSQRHLRTFSLSVTPTPTHARELTVLTLFIR